MRTFGFHLPTNLKIGSGIHRDLPQYLDSESRLLIVTDRGLAETGLVDTVKKASGLDESLMDVFSKVEPNPDEELVAELSDYIKGRGSAQIIALGGGSSMDAAKAASCMAANEGPLSDYQWTSRSFENPSLPLIALPTTAGTGSEVTGVAVITSRNTKKGLVDKQIFPDIALVDPELMRSLPPYVTAITGMDALTHAVEAYVGLGANPFTDSLAETAIELVSDYLPKAYANGEDEEARYSMALASTLAGIAMNQAGLGLVHALSGPVCSYLHLSHGLANALLLPHGLRFNIIARKEKIARIAELMGAETLGLTIEESAYRAVERVRSLIEELELSEPIEKALAVEADIETYAENTLNMFMIHNNPRKADFDDCASIFEDIFYGKE